MKVLFLSFVVGLAVGVVYGLIRVKSPAPPIVALLGLLGMVLGEQVGVWILAKRVNVAQATAVCLTDKHWGLQASARPVLEAHPSAERPKR
jgi:XapX domain-containing protein